MQNTECEKAILNILCKNNDLISEANIEPKDFFLEAHQSIYRRMVDHYEKGESFDLVSICGEMDTEGPVSQYEGFSAIRDIIDMTVLESALQSHLSVLRAYSRRRQLFLAARELERVASDTTEEMEDVNIAVDIILQHAMDIMVDKTAEDFTLADVVVDAICTLTEGNSDMGLLSGLYDLDSTLRGFHPGELIVVAGRPGMGKTALALNIAAKACNDKKSVLFFSLEMAKEQLVQRIIQSETETPAYKYRITAAADMARKPLKPEERADTDRLVRTCDAISEWHLGIVESSGLSSGDISKLSKKWKGKLKGLDLIIIDYLGLMVDPGFKGDTVRMVTQQTRNLKVLAKDLGVPIILLCQLNRAVEQRQDKHPMLADLRDSGSIEQDADVVLFTYRPGYYDGNPDDTRADIDIAKFRNGATCRIQVKYIGNIFKFKSDAPDVLMNKKSLTDKKADEALKDKAETQKKAVNGLDDSLF